MATGLITSLQLLTDWTCNSGSVKGVIPASRWELSERIEQHVVWKTLALTIPVVWELADEVVVGRVVKAFFQDASTDPVTEDWEEYRITDLTIDVRAGVMAVTSVYWLQDLLEKDSLVSVTVSGAVSFTTSDTGVTPTAALTSRVDALLPSYWAVGTVTPTTVIDVAYNVATPLAAGLAIAAACRAVSGVTYELSARRNGTTGLYIDLTVFGGSGTIDVRSRKNLAGIRRTERRGEQTTRAAFSADAALRRPTYIISAVSLNAYVDVTEVGANGPGPAREDDQWNNYYLCEWKNSTTHLITDTARSSYGTTRLSLTSTATLVVGDYVYLAADASATDVSYVDSPALQATYGKRLGVLSGTDPATNLFRNPDLRNGTASTPTSWTINQTPTRVTTEGLWRYGGAAYMLDAGSQSILQSLTVQLTAGDVVTYTAYLKITTFGAASSGYVQFGDPNSGAYGTAYYLDGTTVGLDVLNTFGSVTVQYTVTATGAKTLAFKIVHEPIGVFPSTGVGGGVYYLDAAQVTVTPAAVAFRAGSGAANNVATANAHLDTNGEPIATYDVDLLDLAVLDPATYGDDRPALGATMYLTDDTLAESRSALRQVQLVRSSDRPAAPAVHLSTLPRRLTSILAA